MSSILVIEPEHGLRQALEFLRCEAVAGHGVPESLSCEAASITGRRFEREMTGHMSPRENARVEAYFYAVVRGRAIRSRAPEARAFRSRLLLNSLAADLESTGRSACDIYQEIAQDYATYVEPSVMEAFERSLCGSGISQGQQR